MASSDCKKNWLKISVLLWRIVVVLMIYWFWHSLNTLYSMMIPSCFQWCTCFFLFINNILFIYKYVKEKIYSLVHKNIHVYCTNLIQFNVIMTQVGVVFSAYMYVDHWFPPSVYSVFFPPVYSFHRTSYTSG